MTAARLPTPEDIAAAGRVADVLAAADLQGRALPPTRRDRELPARLRLVYLVAPTIGGVGEELLFAQARHLGALGADVTVLARPDPHDVASPGGERRLGPRARLRHVPYGEIITDAVPPCDLIIAGSWEFVLPARMLAFAPVVLFEQGELRVLGDVPEHIHCVVAASLEAAAVTFALGGEVTSCLELAYGLVARPAPAAVDPARFHLERRRGAAAVREAVVLTGFDAPGADRVAEVEKIAAGLAESHPRVPLHYVSAHDVPGGATARATAGAHEFAELLRSARLCVFVAERPTLDIGPLEAMASGAPVVAFRHPGIAPYAEHNLNCLLAAPGDLDGLLRGARRVLDDPRIADRVRTGGLATAAEHSWPVVGGALLRQYTELAGDSALSAPTGGFEVRLGGLRFARPGDAARLRARLGACMTRHVALPVSQPVLGDYRAVRWRIVASRANGDDAVTRVYLPARSERPLDDAPEQVAINLLREGKAERALDAFAASCDAAPPAEQAVLGRWIVLSMIAAGRPADALKVATAFAHDFPTHPDYIVLAVTAARSGRRPTEIGGPLQRVRLAGAGTRYEEWFDEPYALLERAVANGR